MKKKILVLCGGISKERSISLETGQEVAKELKKKKSKVAGAIWEITREHEKILDNYEQFPNIYQKKYFYLERKKIMFYIMKKYIFKDPPKSYIDTINKGYEDCNIDLRINYRI